MQIACFDRHFFGVGQLALRTTDGRYSPTLVPSTRSGKGRIPAIGAVEKYDSEVWDFIVLEHMSGGSLRKLMKRAARREEVAPNAAAAAAVYPWSERLQHLCDIAARRISAEPIFRLSVAHFTATASMLILAECFAFDRRA